MSDTRPAFVFVHGSCHGAWCWNLVMAQLKAQGHACRALDLPPYVVGAPAEAQVTLEDYAQAIVSDIEAHGGAPVILVGHSAGGYAITAAAAQAPDKIAQLIYVCAYVPSAGMSLADLRRSAAEQPVMCAIDLLPDRLAFVFRQDKAREALFHDCPDSVAEDAMTRLVPQPVRPQNTPVQNLARANAIARSYVRCTEDRVIPPVEQTKMTSDWPKRDVIDMHCGHSPFFADPKGLAEIILTRR